MNRNDTIPYEENPEHGTGLPKTLPGCEALPVIDKVEDHLGVDREAENLYETSKPKRIVIRGRLSHAEG